MPVSHFTPPGPAPGRGFASLIVRVARDHGNELAPPYGVLDFFDISASIAPYNAGCP